MLSSRLYYQNTWILAIALGLSCCTHTASTPPASPRRYLTPALNDETLPQASLITPHLIRDMPHLTYFGGHLLLSTPTTQIVVAGIPASPGARRDYPLVLAYFESQGDTWQAWSDNPILFLRTPSAASRPISFQLLQSPSNATVLIELSNGESLQLTVQQSSPYRLDLQRLQEAKRAKTTAPQSSFYLASSQELTTQQEAGMSFIQASHGQSQMILATATADLKPGRYIEFAIQRSVSVFVGMRGLLAADRDITADPSRQHHSTLRYASPPPARLLRNIRLESGLNFTLASDIAMHLELSELQQQWLQAEQNAAFKKDRKQNLLLLPMQDQPDPPSSQPTTGGGHANSLLGDLQKALAATKPSPRAQGRDQSELHQAEVQIDGIRFDVARFQDPSLGLEVLLIGPLGAFQEIRRRWQEFPMHRNQTWGQRLRQFLDQFYPNQRRELLCPRPVISPIEFEHFALTVGATHINAINCQTKRMGSELLRASNRIQAKLKSRLHLTPVLQEGDALQCSPATHNRSSDQAVPLAKASIEACFMADQVLDFSLQTKLSAASVTWQRPDHRPDKPDDPSERLEIRWILLTESDSDKAELLRFEQFTSPQCSPKNCQSSLPLEPDIRFVRAELIRYNNGKASNAASLIASSQFLQPQ